MSVITHVKKSGNSFALHLPKSFVLAHQLDGDARFRMDYVDGKIVVEQLSAVSEEEAEHDRVFKFLTQGMTRETAQPDMLKSGAVGQELL
jgi:antitoxin component of MazEF toxin-antitoxin module